MSAHDEHATKHNRWFLRHRVREAWWDQNRVKRVLKKLTRVYTRQLKTLGESPTSSSGLMGWRRDVVRYRQGRLTARSKQVRNLQWMLVGIEELEKLLSRASDTSDATKAVGLAFMALRPDPAQIRTSLTVSIARSRSGASTTRRRRNNRKTLDNLIDEQLRLCPDDSDISIARNMGAEANALLKEARSLTDLPQKQDLERKVRPYLITRADRPSQLRSEGSLRKIVGQRRRETE